MASAMHTVVFVDWVLEAKNAQLTSEKAIFNRLMVRKKTEPNEQRRDWNKQSDENSVCKRQLRVQKVGFVMRNGSGWSSKMRSSPRAWSTF